MTLSSVETVPLLSRKSKARLSDCGVVHEVCIDHRGRFPGFSPLSVDDTLSTSELKEFMTLFVNAAHAWITGENAD